MPAEQQKQLSQLYFFLTQVAFLETLYGLPFTKHVLWTASAHSISEMMIACQRPQRFSHIDFLSAVFPTSLIFKAGTFTD